MSYGPIRVDVLPGLRLLDQGVPDTPGAIDILNVQPPQRGVLVARNGYAPRGSFGHDVESIRFVEGITPGHVGAGNGYVEALDIPGTSIANTTLTVGELAPDFEQIGQPGASRLFVASGKQTKTFNGASFAAATGVPNGVALASTAWDNRLMVCGAEVGALGPGGGASSQDHVWFSEAGDPNTFSSTLYELCTPGDGERIVAAIRWREYSFVFKQTKFFVFYSTSVGAGSAITFKKFTVEQGQGAFNPQAVCAGRDGVYFMSRDGIYVTTGEETVPLSDDLEPWFRGRLTPYFSGGVPDQDYLVKTQLEMVGEKLFVTMPVGGSYRQFVTDVRFGGWSFWDLPAAAICATRTTKDEDLLFADGNDLYLQGPTGYLDDDGAEINSFWQGPWETFGLLGEKTIRETRLFCTGRGAVSYASDYREPYGGAQFNVEQKPDLWGDGSDPADLWGDGTDKTDRWGTKGFFDDAWVRWGARGTLLSTRIENVAGSQFAVQWLEHHLMDVREEARDSRAAA